jgi:TetR/AcrR family transcriptional regulator
MDQKNRGEISALGKSSINEKGSVRQRLLTSALNTFSCKGYAATTVREIVAAAGVTKPALYYYFGSKEGIYLALLQEAFVQLDALLEATQKYEGSAEEKLKKLGNQFFPLFLENIGIVQIMYSIYYGPHQGAPFFDFDLYQLKFHQTVQQIVEEGIREQEFTRGNAREKAWLILGAINITMELELTNPEWSLGQNGLARMLDLIFKGMAGEKKNRKGDRKI